MADMMNFVQTSTELKYVGSFMPNLGIQMA